MNQLRAALAIALLASLPACGKEIGDDCATNADCSPTGGRICDVFQPGGYCTVDGCNESSCPDDAVCIRFFGSEFLGEACDPACVPGSGGEGCCVTNDTICLPQGRCALLSAERRYCAKGCGSNGDCRDGYECITSGTRGTIAFTSKTGETPKFCTPAAASQ